MTDHHFYDLYPDDVSDILDRDPGGEENLRVHKTNPLSLSDCNR